MRSIRYFPNNIKNNYFIRIIRASVFFVLIAMLSGCCCLWYVDIDEPELYNKQKNDIRANKIQDSNSEENTNKIKN